MGRERIHSTDLEGQAKRQQAQQQATEQQTDHQPPSGLTANQNAVLNMQQSRGNAAVRRMLVQRAPAGEDGGPIDDDVTRQINSARGSGQTIDSGIASKLGDTMGHDFSGVKVHTDIHADTLNRSLQAKAFTTGSDIFFQQGAYDPSSSGGQHLLAHELTHVVQQSGSSAGGSLTLGPANDSYEQEADAVATQALSSTAAPSVERHMDDDEAVRATRDVQREDMPDDDDLQA